MNYVHNTYRDQRRKMQYRHFRYLDWRRSVYTMLFDWSVQNSVIIYTDSHSSFTHSLGKVTLANEILAILDAMSASPLGGPSPSSTSNEANFFRALSPRRPTPLPRETLESVRMDGQNHVPFHLSRRTGAADRRGECRVHPYRKKTACFCDKCGVFLCHQKCFAMFHSVKNLKSLVSQNRHLFT